jgi:hypothetical protein
MEDTLIFEDIQRPVPDDTVFVVIPPTSEIRRRDRRILQRGVFIKFCIAPDADDGALPTSFNQPTLRWALQLADTVVVCSGEVPCQATTVRETKQAMREFFAPHVRRGGRVAVIKVLPQQADEWLAYTRQACRPNIPIRVLMNVPEAN